MKKLVALLVALLTGSVLVACGENSKDPNASPFFPDDALSIVAATELKDLEPLVMQASRDLGFPITLEFHGGTLQNSQDLKNGKFNGEVDATWMATNRYVDLIGARGALADETKIATSPVAFGVNKAKAKELGWDIKQPTWSDFADAAREGKFTFGMTDPSSSNSGFSALVSVATAMADTGSALTDHDVEKVSPRLQELFQALTLVSGSSGWLADVFKEDPSKADAIINYESTLHQLRAEGAAIEVIVPADGVISADYPLSTLAEPKNDDAAAKVKALSAWLLDHQQSVAESFRRPVSDVENMPAELQGQTVIELPFPGNYGTVQSLVDRYNNEFRTRGNTTFVLDTSGSMEGERLDSLKEIMTSLIDGSAATDTGNVSLRDGEMVTLQQFASVPYVPFTGEYNSADPAVKKQFQDYIDGFQAGGETNIYDTLIDVITKTDPKAGIASIVLLTDGEVTAGRDLATFKQDYDRITLKKGTVPVFVILYGEANVEEMNLLADMTGGAVFDALNGDLAEAFKEIRGYQ